MSVRHGHVSRRCPRFRAATLMLTLAGLVSISGARLANAAPAPAATRLTAGEAASAGTAIVVSRRAEGGGSLIVVTLPAAAPNASLPAAERSRRSALRVLAVAEDGSAAIADAVGVPGAGLTIAHPDGSQARTGLAGVAGAAFSPDLDWLAAADASGRLWRVEIDTGHATQLADGPYGGSLAFERDGSLLLVALSSAGAPYESRLVRFNPESGRSQPLVSDPGFIFSARQLTDGSVAAVVHPSGGGVRVVRVGAEGARPLADLGPEAIDATVSADGRTIAFAIAGDGVYLVDGRSPSGRRLGEGDLPRIAPDGGSVVMLRDGASLLVTADGRERERFSAAVAWASCGAGCRP